MWLFAGCDCYVVVLLDVIAMWLFVGCDCYVVVCWM